MKNTIISVVIVILAAIGIYFLVRSSPGTPEVTQNQSEATTTVANGGQTDGTQNNGPVVVIGKSVQGRDITAYHFGSGSKEVLFVGGIHGGYEWNTVLVAYNLVDYLKANPDAVPANLKVTVIPVLNPDGLSKVVGTTTRFTAADVSASQTVQISGRFNGDNVDLNRNFDCDWQSAGVWQSKTVSGGSAAFSEPESQAVKQYIASYNPEAVVVWYSAAGGVYSSSCHNGVSSETSALTEAYAKASGYPAHETFDFYATTGDMTNWLAKISIPAISVILTTHQDVEWNKNLAGVKAVLAHYAE